MKQFSLRGAILLAFVVGAFGGDLDAIQGRWMVKKTLDDRPVTQTLEFKKDKSSFRLEAEGKTIFFGASEVEIQGAGVFRAIRFYNIKFGENENDLNDAGEDRSVVFALQNGVLYIANSFDRERENEKPGVDAYSKIADSGKGASELVGSWKLGLELNETTYDYTLRISEHDGKLSALFVSPRSGEHKAKSISFVDGTVKIEMDRTIENNAVTFVYVGKLEGKKLAGKCEVKGLGDGTEGVWSANKQHGESPNHRDP